ncbi:MAG: hypothetical protein JNL79_32555 [Myxococcales bacterium]|nr:hypothetical protein [Myxococcales bacterium]
MALALPFDPTTLPGPVARIVGDKTPPALRMMAAKGAAPGLRPEQIVLTLVLLARADLAHVEPAAKETAEATLTALPTAIRDAALAAHELSPLALDVMADTVSSDVTILERVVTHPALANATALRLAKEGNEAITELVAINEERLLAFPEIIEALYMNKRVRSSTADRVLDLAVRNGKTLNIPTFKEAAEAIQGELILAPDAEPTPDDILFAEAAALAEAIDGEVIKEDDTGEEVVEEKALPLEQRIRQMTVSQKVRTATLGTAAVRALLVRDKNKLVATAVIRSPLLQENEAAAFSASRGVSEDVLRLIASNGELVKSHTVKFNLVSNPKTPMAYSLRLLPHLRGDELKKLAKSKNVPGQIAKLAKQELEKKAPR